MTIGQAIKHYREKAKLSQDDLAARVGLFKTKISQLENGHSDPRLSTLQRYAEALGVPAWKLIKDLKS